MARYFDADKVESIIDCVGDLQEAKSCISMLQYEDVHPVIHAKWIYDKTSQIWRCSECNETPKTLGFVGTSDFMKKEFTFCNHCGAKMVGAEDE